MAEQFGLSENIACCDGTRMLADVSALGSKLQGSFEDEIKWSVALGVTAKTAKIALDLIRAKRLARAAKVAEGMYDAGGPGAMQRLQFNASPKHHPNVSGSVSPGPVNGQAALDTSLQIKPTSPRRVGIDYESGEFVIFDQTTPGVFHGHVRPFSELPQEAQNLLRKMGMIDSRGNLK